MANYSQKRKEEGSMASFNVRCNPIKRYVEELRKTKKQSPIILELLAKMSCQLLDPNVQSLSESLENL